LQGERSKNPPGSIKTSDITGGSGGKGEDGHIGGEGGDGEGPRVQMSPGEFSRLGNISGGTGGAGGNGVDGNGVDVGGKGATGKAPATQ